MRPIRLSLAAVAATVWLNLPAAATTVFPTKITCPVGGEVFDGYAIGSWSSFGQRPDGRGYGTLPVYPLQECPGNGFVIFDETFTPDERTALAAAVASPEYRALRTSETPHYRAWWLIDRIGRNPYQATWQLLQASWESDENFDRKVRYQAAFIAAATGLKRDDEHADHWTLYQVRAANALRELGYFDKAAALLDRIDKPEFLPADADDAKGAKELIAGLRTLIVEANPVSTPANLIPDREAAQRCEIAIPPLTPIELTVCSKPEIAKLRKQAREWLDKEMRRREKDRPKPAG